VIVDAFKEEENITRIAATIYVSRDSQKGIVIGHQGKMIKLLGTKARKEMEEFLQQKVFLELFVKVQKNWRDDERHLKNFGYIN
jgi:GTP-binding protein Era